MKAAFILIGDELLNGTKADKNGIFMAEKWQEVGGEVVHIACVRDREEDIVGALGTASEKAAFVFLSGGLGPTEDDLTREALRSYFNLKASTYDSKALARMQDYKKGQVLSDRDKKQALVYKEATVIFENVAGAAPAMGFEKASVFFLSLPGVPIELRTIFTTQALPYIQQHYGSQALPPSPVFWLILQGISEAALAKAMQDWHAKASPSLRLAYLPEAGLIYLRLSSEDPHEYPALGTLHAALAQQFAPFVLSREKIDFLAAIKEKLRHEKYTIATAESCTGGALAAALSEEKGASDFFIGGEVLYTNRMKREHLGLDFLLDEDEAVTEEVADAMLVQILAQTHAHIGIATTGYLNTNPAYPHSKREVWIALGTKEKRQLYKEELRLDDREYNRNYILQRTWFLLYAFLKSGG